jgi:hypothetical protein
MSQEIPVLLDPSLKLDPADLKAAWDADPEAKKLGSLEMRPSKQVLTGVVELVVIPLAVEVAAGLITEAIILTIKRLMEEKKTKVPFTVKKEPLDKGQEAVLVQKK